ncbi:MAG: nuclear transport factor 2 family protein [Acidobacteriota bacterium]
MQRICPVLPLILVAATLSPVFAQSGAPSRLDRLEVGIERAEAIRSIKRLQSTYHGYLDNGLWSEITELLAANATADFAGTKFTGKAAITQHLMQEAGRTENGLASDQLNTHLLMQPIINLGPDGKTAQGTWHDLAM